VLDSKQTEGMVRRVLGEHTRRDTPRYDYIHVLIVTSLVLICCCAVSAHKEFNHRKSKNRPRRKTVEMRKAILLRHRRLR